MAAVKTRSELDEALTWDLSLIYKSEEDWEKDFASLDGLLADFLKCRGKLDQSARILLEALEADDRLSLILERLYVYAHLKADEDTGNSAGQTRLERIRAKETEISGECSFFQPELLAVEETRFQEYLNSDILSFYKRSLQELAEERAHTLSAAEERILSLSADVMSSSEKVFSLLNDADLRFPQITNDAGEKEELTHGNYIRFLESSVRQVRKDAFYGCYNTYSSFRNTLSALLDTEVKAHILDAELRKFPSALEASLFADKVPLRVYNGLIDSVHNNMDLIHRYYALRAKVLKLDQLDMYDIYTPLLPECNAGFSWEESVKDVKDSLKVLGVEYHNAIGQAFTDRWIDVMECRSKRSGAYSSGCYGMAPYMLLNYSGTLDSMFTLTHELGHSMHSYFSDRNQPYHYASYKIFVAEVASTTNELLLMNHLLKKAPDKNMKGYLLNHLADEFRGTLFRQTMFAEFERDIHDMAGEGTPLTWEVLSDHYKKLNDTYHGDAVKADDLIRYEWSRIPHFYYNFYVYKYATGFSAAAALSQMILKGKTDTYMQFLKSGDSKDVLDIMKDAGVDFLDGDPVGDAMKLFDETLTSLEECLQN
ncbi:MAG: oligoendopeptidase F [Lentisphaeria bacterium]|nr:oligoendopeptidase F [Lentisphaeria bacterium]